MRNVLTTLVSFSLLAQAQTFRVQRRAAAPSGPQSIGYAISVGTTPSSAVNTTGASLVVVQCNSFSAACHSGTSFGTGNTYTAFGSGCVSGSSHAQFYYKINPTAGSTTWTGTGSDTLYISIYSGTATSTPLYFGNVSDTCAPNNGSFDSILSLTLNNVADVLITGSSGNDTGTDTLSGTNATLVKQKSYHAGLSVETGSGGDSCALAGGACVASSSTSVTATWHNNGSSVVGIAAGINKQ